MPEGQNGWQRISRGHRKSHKPCVQACVSAKRASIAVPWLHNPRTYSPAHKKSVKVDDFDDKKT